MTPQHPTTRILLLGNLLLLFGTINWMTLGKESHLANGTRILLHITRFDPRSLLQGDYMALRYAIASEIERQLQPNASGEGQAVIAIDHDDLATFRRLADDTALLPDEHLLHYRIRWGHADRVRFAAEEFLFQEGLTDEYAKARFAELRLNASGHTLLVGLLDQDRKPLGTR